MIELDTKLLDLFKGYVVRKDVVLLTAGAFLLDRVLKSENT